MQQEKGKTTVFGFGFGDGKQWQGSGAAQLAAGRWQHVAVVCDGSNAFFYVNGEGKSSAAAAGVFAPNPDMTFRLGQGYRESRFFRGLLNDVRLYRLALTAAEVRGDAARSIDRGAGMGQSGGRSGRAGSCGPCMAQVQ